MFYSNKYKKYKEKYINLKNSEKILIIENMNGGKITKNKIFDLSIDYKFSNDLQNNLTSSIFITLFVCSQDRIRTCM